MCYTSGTSGAPKAVILTHEGVCAATRAKLDVVGYDAEDTYLHMAPLYHVGGLSSAHATLAAGANHVFVNKFDPAHVLRVIVDEGVTAFIAVPAMMRALVDSVTGSRREDNAFPTVRKILVGAGRLTDGLYDSIRRVFPNATVTMAYGMTEATSSVTFLSPDDARLMVDSTFAGNAAPGVEVKTDAEGQLLVRGSSLMLGYVGIDRADTFDVDGWFATGDLGAVEDAQDEETGSRVWLRGRAKDMIKSGGENVSPEEVERVLNAHADVATSVVIGASHEKWGEAVVAVVKLRVTAADTEDERIAALREWCAESRLARFKIPKCFVFTEDVRSNAMGKLMRAATASVNSAAIAEAVARVR
jgi:acyl-activating enzyme 14